LLAAYLVGAELLGLLVGENDDPPRGVTEPFEHPTSRTSLGSSHADHLLITC
jgi:hypothetical protein